MKNNKSWLMALAAVAALTSAQTARGITFGEPDNGRHPNVGAVMLVLPNLPNLPNPAQFLSGTLIAPNLFLTAGHGTAYLEWLMEAGVVTFDNVFVTFSGDPTDKASYMRIKAIRTHPGYTAAKATDVDWLDAHGQGSIPIDDMGLLVLEDVPTGIVPAELPLAGFLDGLKRARQLTPDTKILAVGYGSRATFRPSTPVGIHEPHSRELVYSEYRGFNDTCLTVSMNQVLGNGGGGVGDSGGPRFWIDPADGSEHLVSITERGDPNLVSLDVTYRIDTPVAQDFIEAVKKEYPLVPSLLAGDAMAGRRPTPPVCVLWPTGAKLVLQSYGFSPSLRLYGIGVAWPIASGADHYRLTVVCKSNGASSFEISPVDYLIGSDGLAHKGFSAISAENYSITVTAYSGPDEAVAYSESLQAQIKVH